MQGLTATTRPGVTGERNIKRSKHAGNLCRKNLQTRYMLIIDLKPPRSQVEGKHSMGREFQSLAVKQK